MALMAKDFNKSLSGDGDDLPQELAHNFEALRSLLAKSDEGKEEKRASEAGSLDSMPDVKNRKATEELAFATALAVEREITFLQNGIAELEALLAVTAQQDVSRHPEPSDLRHALPSLPLVPDDDVYERYKHCSKQATIRSEE
jgi:hypothetical protein